MVYARVVLRITNQNNASGTKQYFHAGHDFDYLAETVGEWEGVGSELLGLKGKVDQARFDLLCDNTNPETGEQLTSKNLHNRRVGFDFTWSAPKSISVVHALSGDDRLLQAFRDSVKETMAEMEKEVEVRVRKGGATGNRETGNWIYSEFIHLTSRPVNGEPCPQMHLHCFVQNASREEEDGRLVWKAIELGRLRESSYYWEQVQRARLALKVQELGYSVRRTKDAFEISGVPLSVLDKFSLRTKLIERVAKALGVTSPESKAKLGGTTRERKGQMPYRELVDKWQGRLSADEADALKSLPKAGSTTLDNARHARFAVDHTFERVSVADERRILALALRHGCGEVTPEGIRSEADKLLLKKSENGRTWATTSQVLEEERRMIAFAVAGKGTCRTLDVDATNRRGGYKALDPRLFQPSSPQPSNPAILSDEQQAVIDHLLTSQDRVMLVRGAAGTGKTTLATEAVRRINAVGKHVEMLAPTTAAVGVLKKDGFDANTVAALLNRKDLQERAKDSVLWVDEAGLVGTKTMASLFQLADQLNARVILMGDKRQLASVERGSPLRVLEDIAKLPVAEVTEIRRQSGKYKEAVKLLSKGKAAEGLDALDAMKAVKKLKGYEDVAREYVDALKQGSALIVCPTHAEGEKVTEAVRNRLKQEGRLGREERVFTRLVARQLTEAERTETCSYVPGDVAAFHRRQGAFQAGQRVVVESGNGAVLAASGRGLSLFGVQPIALGYGDQIRITANGKTLDGKHRLGNGSQYVVSGFDREGNIRLNNGWTISKGFGHLTHGYVNTAFAAQGRTVDRVMVVAGQSSFPAMTKEAFYVAVSRGRRSATVWTDDRRELREMIERSQGKMSATELIKPKPQPSWWKRMRQYMQRAQAAAKSRVREIGETINQRGLGYAR